MDQDYGKDGKAIRECVDKVDKIDKVEKTNKDHDTIDRSTNPHVGEDPGLLESTEDPRERRLKRHTM